MLLDPKITAYKGTSCSAQQSKNEVEKFLEKLGIKTFMWNRDSPDKAYLLFKYQSKYTTEPIAYKVSVPFIEKMPSGMNRKSHPEKAIFDEKRSYRFFWHIFKNCMLMGEIGMEIEQIFRDFLVIGKNPDGTPMTLGEKHDTLMTEGNVPALTSVI